MHVELLTIGDELCRGEIVNTNGAWMAAKLWDMQISVDHIVTCGDLEPEMTAALRNAAKRSDLVLVCGGLGPTVDDLTVDVVSKVAGLRAVEHKPSAKRMKVRFTELGIPLIGDVMRQVRHPEGSTVYENPVGAAPSFEICLDNAVVICLPGPPREMKSIFTTHLEARIAQLRAASGQEVECVAKKIFRVFGKGESVIAAAMEGLQLGQGASLHYQVVFPEVLVKVVVRDKDEYLARDQLDRVSKDVRIRLDGAIYGEDDTSMAQAVGDLLRQRGETIATAESCTGGMIGGKLTDAPGSSEYYLGGAVTYSNAEKTRQCGVEELVLETHGAVSQEVVIAMAEGIRERVGSSWAVSVSGIAGPGGGSDDRPVGTVWVAVAGPDGKTTSKKYSWPGDRDRVRLLACNWALNAVRRRIIEEETI
ncbi:MAG: competence/damage-inducible protein A [Kofleriaceae bacterium]|nr:competence/damage-inducible protein A [Kofleriaceae bacterium]